MLSPKIHLQQRPESSRFGKPHAHLLARTMHGKDRSLALVLTVTACSASVTIQIVRASAGSFLLPMSKALMNFAGIHLTLCPILDSALVRRWAPASFHPD